MKRNLSGVAQAFLTEENVSIAPVAIDSPAGFLSEWWYTFWDTAEEVSVLCVQPRLRHLPAGSAMDESRSIILQCQTLSKDCFNSSLVNFRNMISMSHLASVCCLDDNHL